MVKVSDCTCCDCDSAQEKEQIKERALSSINKVYTFDNRTFWPDGTGMVTIPLPTQEQLNLLDDMAGTIKQVDTNTADIGTLKEQVSGNTADIATAQTQIAKNAAGIATNAELIAGEQTQIDSIKTSLETSYQAIAQKGSANGYAGLDNNARVPLAQLYAGTSANQMPLIGKQLLANEMLIVDADGLTIRSRPIVQTLSFRGIYATKEALPSEGNVSGDYAIVSDGTAQDDTGYYVWGFNNATNTYEWVWTILFDANSYQLMSNLVTSLDDSSDDSHYPSAKAVKDYHDASVGTLEQEITDINNDLAAVQTTLNEHTTGIANAISQAQDCYSGVTQSGSSVTLTKSNGTSDTITIPEGIKFCPLIKIPSSLITDTPSTSTTIYRLLSSTSPRLIVFPNALEGKWINMNSLYAYSSLDNWNNSSSVTTTAYYASATNIPEIAEYIVSELKNILDFNAYKEAGLTRMTFTITTIYAHSGNSTLYTSAFSNTLIYSLKTDTITSYPNSLRIISKTSSIPDSCYIAYQMTEWY